MAGLPEEVVTRAAEILRDLESDEIDITVHRQVRKPGKRLSDCPGQMTFF